MHPHRVLWLSLAFLATATSRAAAQSACSTWDPLFRSPGVGLTTDWVNSQITLGWIEDALEFDDGSGSALYAGGDFTSVAGAPANGIARRRAGGWESVGSGPLGLLGSAQGHVSALASFTNGSVPALFAAVNDDSAGRFELGAWDGSSWTSVGGGFGAIHALEVYDDGSGSALYVGGEFTSVSTLSGANRIARWTPSGWSLVGSGLSGGAAPAVLDFTVHDDGSGPALVVAGRFTSAGGVAGSCVARWNGAWSTFSGTFSNEVRAVTSFNDGAGARLYAGGSFTASGGIAAANLVRWNGSAWSALPNLSSSSAVLTLATSTATGAGTELLVGAEDAISFTNGGVPGTSYGCVLWTGSTWTQMNANPLPAPPGLPSTPIVGARAFADFDPGTGARAYVLGGFPQIAGLGAAGLARWNGTSLEVDDAGQGFDWPADVIRELHYPTASDTQIFAAGAFLNAGPTPVQPAGTSLSARARTLAVWDGTSWTGMGTGLPASATVWDLEAYDPGTGPILYAATQSGLYSWNAGTSTWGLVTGTLAPSGVIRSLCVYNGELFVAGTFTNLVRRWNGTNWNQVGPGLGGGTIVSDLEVYNPGTGPELFACGDFTAINPSTSTPFIASWNGAVWTALPTLPTTTPNSLRSMTVYDDGLGPKLVVTALRTLSSNTVTDVLSWNGSAWGTLGTFLQGTTFDIAATDRFPGGAVFPFSRSRLVAAGSYTAVTSSVELHDLLEWTGTGWQSFGSCTALPLAFGSITLGTGGANGHTELWVAGAFESMSGVASGGLALHRDCAFQTFCAGDGLDPNVTTACPCGNFGLLDHGCNNKSGTGGAYLTGSGDTLTPAGAGYTDSVLLTCSGMNIPATFAIFFQGSATNPGGALLGNGVVCVTGTLLRIRNQSTTGIGFAQYPLPGQVSLSTRSANMGDPLLPGMVRYYFATYRDIQNPAGCTGNVETVSNGLAILW